MITAEKLRELLSIHGSVRSQPVTDWSGPFPLPASVEQFYRDVGPVDIEIEGYGNPYFLPALGRLWEYQAGYRWNGKTGDLIDDWSDDWLVVADEGADPFILSRASGKISLAMHGAGVWEPHEIFPDIYTMSACLAEVGGLVVSAGDDLTDDECDIRPEHYRRAIEKLRELLGSSSEAIETLESLGWVQVSGKDSDGHPGS